jgi:hypothetical protein
LGFLYRAARLSQGAQFNARGRRAEKRTIANQQQRKAEQIENARYQLKKAQAKGDHLAVEHWAERLRILGAPVAVTMTISQPVMTDEERAIVKRATDYIKSAIGHPERLADAKRAADDYNRVARRVNARIEQRIKAGDPSFDEDDTLSIITIEDE